MYGLLELISFKKTGTIPVWHARVLPQSKTVPMFCIHQSSRPTEQLLRAPVCCSSSLQTPNPGIMREDDPIGRVGTPAVISIGDSGIRSSDRWQGEPRRRCSVFRYGGRRHDSALDS